MDFCDIINGSVEKGDRSVLEEQAAKRRWPIRIGQRPEHHAKYSLGIAW